MTYDEAIRTARGIRPGTPTTEVTRLLGEPDREAEDVISYDLTKRNGFPGMSAEAGARVFFAVEVLVVRDRVKEVNFAWIDVTA